MPPRHVARLLLFAALALALVASTLSAEDASNPGTPVVQQLQAALLDVMKNGEKLDVKGRFERLEPVVRQAHDFDYVVPKVFGVDWQPLTDEQKRTVRDLYQRVSTMTFARQFDAYHGERFEIVDEKPAEDGDRFVRTVMHLPNGEKVHFNYLLHQSGGQWRIVNTLFDGVSGFTMDRSRYQPLLQQQGADALIAELSKQAAGYP